MKITERLSEGFERLRTAPGEELGRWARFVRFQMQLWRFCARRLREHNAAAMSAALSFRTIFALVPALVLVMLTLKSAGMLEQSKKNLRTFLEGSHFAAIVVTEKSPPAPNGEAATTRPARTVSLADEIEKLIAKVEAQLTLGRVGPVGAVLLIWSAIALLSTMERSLNRIFGARRGRGMGRRVMLYWSVVTLGPMVLVAAAYLAGSAAQAGQELWGLSWLVSAAGWGGPVVLQIVLLAALYKLMPNTKVRYRAAAGGALIAMPLWLLAKWAFGLYVANLSGSLYGALGLLPLFLIWLNLSWLIFLFGAELAHTAANLERMQSEERAERAVLGPNEMLAVAAVVARNYRTGGGPTSFEQICRLVALPELSLREVIDRLRSSRVLCPVEADAGEAYVLARPAERIGVMDVIELSPEGTGRGLLPACDPAIAGAVARVRRQTRTALGSMTLADVLTPAGDDEADG